MIAGIKRIWLIITALMIGPVLLFSFRNFWSIEIALWLGALPATAVSFRWLRTVPRWMSWLLVLLAYGLLSAFWSPSDRALELLWYLLLIVVSAGILSELKINKGAMLAGVFIAVALLLCDAVTGNAIREVVPPENTDIRDANATGRGLGLLLFLLPGAALLAYRRREWRGGRGMILLTGIAAASTPILLNGVALLAGLGAMLFTAWRPVVGLRSVIAACGAVLASPFLLAAFLPRQATIVTLGGLPDSTVHRLVIWRSVLDEWLTGGLIFGEGARATEVLGAGGETIVLPGGQSVPLVSVHPHNLPIEVLYEFGLLGFALLLTAFAAGARALLSARFSRDMAAAVSVLVVVSALNAAMDMTLYNVHTVSALVLGVLMLRLADGKNAA